MQPPSSPKKRIAVLGGGMASLSAVFELTSQPGWQDRYEITVYQQGHRLGGKCASARAFRDGIERIEEHGLHVFFGFYDNTFDLMRRVYAERDELPAALHERRLGFDKAFLPNDLVLLGEERGSALDTWTLPFPSRSGTPGKARKGEDHLTLGSVLGGLLELAVAQVLAVADQHMDSSGSPQDRPARQLGQVLSGMRNDSVDLFPTMLKALRSANKVLQGDATLKNLVEALDIAKDAASRLDDLNLGKSVLVRAPLTLVLKQLRAMFRVAFEAIRLNDFRFSQLGISVDLALTFAIGILDDRLLQGETDWFALDNMEYRAWLHKHGARAETIASPPLATLADATFSDSRYDGAGAGTTLHLTLRMLLHYKGAILFKLAAGMGETVIAPLYQVLSARGVKFRFFHRIQQLEPGMIGNSPVVSKITFKEQATVRRAQRGARQYDEYLPLIQSPSDGLMCFPDHPIYSQLEEGAQLQAAGHNLESSWNAWDTSRETKVLEFGRDYDCVVLGISVGALRPLCTQLLDAERQIPPVKRGDRQAPRLSQMIAKVASVETMAAQLWFKDKFSQLKAPASSGLGINYPQPFDTWSDMTHVIAHERWPGATPPRSVVYLCTSIDEPHGYEPPPYDDYQHPAQQRALVRRSLEHWLENSAPRVFQELKSAQGGFDFDSLIDPQGRSGADRLDAQWYCASDNASDRYVLSVPGSNQFRLRPHESGFANLVLAGDWTLNALSAGCVEGAVISGLEASRALIGDTREISGDWLTRVHSDLVCKQPLLEHLPVDPARARQGETGQVLAFTRSGQVSGKTEELATRVFPKLPELDYFRRPFDLIPRPTYICQNTQTDWFFFKADEAKLQAICDRMLNHPDSPTVYSPAVPVVAFVAAQLGKTFPDEERIAFMPEKDYAFWIPVQAEAKPGRDDHVASPTAWLQPCLWVDSHPAVIGGREVYGVNKALAVLGAPTPQSPKFTIDTVTIKKQNDPRGAEPDQRAEQARLLELEGDQLAELPEEDEVVSAFSDLLGLAESVLKTDDPVGNLGLLLELYNLLRGGGIPLVALKFFPDAADPEQACYKALVEAKSTLQSKLSIGIRRGQHRLRLFRFESHPIAELFGLQLDGGDAQQGDLATPFFAMTARFDFALEKGRVIYDFIRDKRADEPDRTATSA